MADQTATSTTGKAWKWPYIEKHNHLHPVGSRAPLTGAEDSTELEQLLQSMMVKK
jgi:hypothetical protein